ncbi:MAG: FkbM family methyltransferase [Candidatus Omnitrophica bacterium]|nr:FkbM family methyltransferase [Candidatus Omnitrophota bacterium]
MADRLTELFRKFKAGQIDKKSYIRRMHDMHASLWKYRDFIRDRNVESIKISKDCLTLTTMDGITMICDRDDERSIPMEILNFGDYEAAEMRMMKKFVGKKSVVLDIGANIGWYSINLSRCAPGGRIMAFEPVPGVFKYLKRNIALNGVKNVEALNYGLSDRSAIMEFYYDPKLTVATSSRNLYGDRKKRKIRCRVRRLDDFILRLTPRIDFIKCDVEGAELFVVRGAIETLKKARPVLFLEMLRKWSAKFGYHPNDIMGLLGGVGYGCYYAKSDRLEEIAKVDERTKATNFYFLDGKKHSKLIRELT